MCGDIHIITLKPLLNPHPDPKPQHSNTALTNYSNLALAHVLQLFLVSVVCWGEGVQALRVCAGAHIFNVERKCLPFLLPRLWCMRCWCVGADVDVS